MKNCIVSTIGILTTLSFCLFLNSCSTKRESKKQAEEKPNIVIVLADDASRAYFGSSNSGFYTKTPNIDKLATEGMQLTQFYTATSMCAPCRHELYTGMMPSRSGMHQNHSKPKADFENIKTLLSPLGYNVGLAGKLHFLTKNPLDKIEGFAGGQRDPQENWTFNYVKEYMQHSMKENKPFCFILGSALPHSPWASGKPEEIDPAKVTVPPHMIDTKATREMIVAHMAEIVLLDKQVGQTDSLLKALNIDQETIFIFLSEQGSSLPLAKLSGNNFGFHSECLIRWPGKIKPGTKNPAIGQYVDVLPTLVEIAGGKAPESMDGKSMLDVWLNKKTSHREYAYTSFHTDYRRAINNDEFRLIKTVPGKYAREFHVDPMFQPYWPEWLEVAKTDPEAKEKVERISRDFRTYEFYNIKNDPFERFDLADDPKYAEVLEKMKEDFEKEYSRLNDDFDDYISREASKKMEQETKEKKKNT